MSNNPDIDEIGLLHADSTEPGAPTHIARRAGSHHRSPYLKYGLPLVAACAANGTDYVDLTAEPEFVDRAFVDSNATAERTGARIVHSCGFGSLPPVLGALSTAEQLPDDAPITMRSSIRISGGVSGGAIHSWVNQLAHIRPMLKVARERRKLESVPTERKAQAKIIFPRHDRTIGNWLIPFPTLDANLSPGRL